jgi:hypothetical protein
MLRTKSQRPYLWRGRRVMVRRAGLLHCGDISGVGQGSQCADLGSILHFHPPVLVISNVNSVQKSPGANC